MTEATLEALTAKVARVGLFELAADIELMERYDTKLTGPVDALPGLIDLVGDRVRVVEVEGTRVARVATTYFDTPDAALFRDHVQGRRRRYKIRVRRYDSSGDGFLEVKAKTNRRQTVKHRTPYPGWDVLNEDALDFISYVLDTTYGFETPPNLERRLTTSFLRTTLVDDVNRERITIDAELVASVSGKDLVFNPDRVIIEAKSDRSYPRSARGLQRLGFRPMSLSKYCMVMTCGEPDLAGNEWTQALRWFQPVASTAS